MNSEKRNIGTDKLRVSIYARKSAPDERDTSIETQIANCRDFLNNYPFLQEYIVYQEDDASGMFTNRTEYQKMLNLAKSGGIDVIVVMKLDRLNRNYANGETAIKLLNSYGCFVIAGDMKNPETPVDEFTRGILMLQNQYIVRLIASDTMRVEMNNVKNGLSAGGVAPYGYTVINKRYYINEDEAPAIRVIFDKISKGESYSQVIGELNRLGYTTRSGQQFSYTTLNAMLKNEKYCGIYVYNRKDGKKKKNRVLIENFDEVRNETAIPPIIDRKKFDKVQKILKQRITAPVSSVNSPFILTGLIFCKQCGSSMCGVSQISGRDKKKYRTYACQNHRVKHCSTKPINADYLETAVKSIITESVNDYLLQSPIKNNVLTDIQKELKENISIMSKNKKDIDLKINNLIDRISKSSNSTLISRYESSIEADTAKQKALQQNIEQTEKKVLSIEALKTNNFSDMLTIDDLFPTIEESRRLVRLFIKKIEFDESSGDIDISFNV